MSLITYYVVADHRGLLRETAKTACDFWNRFVQPSSAIVVRLGIFSDQFGTTIARAYRPYVRDGVVYGVVEFNTRYLATFGSDDIAGTLIHEIGHILGIGWDKWLEMFSHRTGRFHSKWTNKVEALGEMLVETDYGPGTTLAHWDEETFDNELMSGFKDEVEYVLPVTIDVLGLLGHTVVERLSAKRNLKDIIDDSRRMVFSRQEQVLEIARDVFIATEIWEEIYDKKRRPLNIGRDR